MMTSRTGQRRFRAAWWGFLALIACGAGVPAALGASIAEPSTVFYGKVTGTGSGQPFLLTEGELHWTIRRADGTSLPLRTRLWPVNDGEFSYRLDVPQQALALGLVTASGTLPLKIVQETHSIVEILVNGVQARISGPAGATFDAAQIRRATTHRLDIEVPLVAPDSDADGLPDWWEKKAGRDLDPAGDLDGDGVANLREYVAGSDPLKDSRRPTIATTAIRAYADGTSGVVLRALDSDTGSDALIYTLTQAPAGAELRLRNARPNPANPDLALAAGASFTQRDVLSGRLILVQSGGAAEPTSFTVTLRDGGPGTESEPASIKVSFYRPAAALLAGTPALAGVGAGAFAASAEEVRRAGNYLLARDHGAVIWDGLDATTDLAIAAPSSALNASEYASAYVGNFGEERAQIVLGGLGNDTLSGGMAADVIAGGGGQNRLTGRGGPDRFVLTESTAGTDTVTDFNPDEGDVLDLTALFSGSSLRLNDYLRVTADPNGARLALDRSGSRGEFSDRAISLAGLAPAQVDLATLVDRGALVVGALTTPARISLEASRPGAAENGPRSGEFVLRRAGNAEAAIMVRLEVRGSAVNGVDYATLPGSVNFAAGQREAKIFVEPFADSQAEPAETVEVSVLSSDDYEVAATGKAVVLIADLQSVVRIEALEALATTQPASPATLLISRDTVVDRTLLVRLDIRGSAVNGVDYQSVPKFVNFAAGQTTALIPIAPTGAAPGSGSGKAKTVEVTLVPDATYLVGDRAKAEVLLVSERTSFAAWRARHLPGASGTDAAVGSADPGGAGVANALRYAFGMDPQKPDRARMPKLVVRDGHLTLDVWRRPEAQDVEFVTEVSSDLSNWRAGADLVEQVVPPEHAGNPEVICFRALRPLKDAPQMFLNLRVRIRQ